jgi:CDP-diacylglycerol--glycerol-3-phosphate 3-phosphatidyltransferase
MDILERVRTFGELHLRRAFTPLAHLFARVGITPNQVSTAGFMLSIISAALIVLDHWVAAAIVFLVASSFDLIDGTLARLDNQTTVFGKFLDSTLDRLSEGTVLAAIAYWFAQQGDAIPVAAVFLALLGGLLTSYTRARAEALGASCKVGWVTRPERVLMIGIGLLFDVMSTAMYLLAALTLATALQRVLHVYKDLYTPSKD